MLGAIIGDIVGSVYEFSNIKSKNFEFCQERMQYTDDSILTIATADWLTNGGDAAEYYADWSIGYPYPMGGYGTGFVCWQQKWKTEGYAEPYNSCGNGSAMRVSPVAWLYDTEEEVLAKAKESAECTHNHPGGIAGAQATALCILMARQGKSKDYIRQAITERFGYDLTHSVEHLQRVYSWDGMPGSEWRGGTCQGSVPQAIICALEADSFESAVRNAISIGGDSDTIGCITGSIAEALYGIPEDLTTWGLSKLPEDFIEVMRSFAAMLYVIKDK